MNIAPYKPSLIRELGAERLTLTHEKRRVETQDASADNDRRPASALYDPLPCGAAVRPNGGAAEHRATARALCFCVDDFGLHDNVYGAAVMLIAMGRVHAVSCLTGPRSWTDCAPGLSRIDSENLDVGLQLDLTEFPLAIRPFDSLGALIARSYTGRLDRRAIRSEIRAQLNEFEDEMDRPPAFVDGHRNVHQLPVVRTELLEELKSRYPLSPPWVRSTRTGESAWFGTGKAHAIDALGARAFTSQAHRSGVPSNSRLFGVYDFLGGTRRYRSLMRGWLAAAQDADLVRCHPSLMADAEDLLSSAQRAQYDVLASAAFGAMLANERIELKPMSQILKPAGASA